MKDRTTMGTLEKARAVLRKLVRERGLARKQVSVSVKPLTPEEAIGRTKRKDYPILKGKERVIEAVVLGAKGQVFTDSPSDFSGTLGGVLRLGLRDSRSRALVVAVINAACRALGITSGTIHCKDAEPEQCAVKIAADILLRRGRCRVGLIGFQPAFAARLVRTFGRANVRILDRNSANIGSVKCGVRIRGGRQDAQALARWADVVLITGTTLVNGTFDSLLRFMRRYDKEFIIYGISIAGTAALLGLPRVCHCGRDD